MAFPICSSLARGYSSSRFSKFQTHIETEIYCFQCIGLILRSFMIETWIVESGSASIFIQLSCITSLSLRFFNHEMGTLTLYLFLEVEWKLNNIHVKQFLQYCFCFMFWIFGHKACGILTPQPGIEPIPPALEGKD